MVVKGYWENEEVNRASFSEEGWFKTGDVAVFRKGLFYIVDRKKVRCVFDGCGWGIALLMRCGLGTHQVQGNTGCAG